MHLGESTMRRQPPITLTGIGTGRALPYRSLVPPTESTASSNTFTSRRRIRDQSMLDCNLHNESSSPFPPSHYIVISITIVDLYLNWNHLSIQNLGIVSSHRFIGRSLCYYFLSFQSLEKSWKYLLPSADVSFDHSLPIVAFVGIHGNFRIGTNKFDEWPLY
jgi:hypothetical protein